MNALEQAAIARQVKDSIVDGVLFDEPKSFAELVSLARELVEEKGITDPMEIGLVALMVITDVSNDPNVHVEAEDSTDMSSWVYSRRN
ncbi:MAG TPA: hypothetical protein VIB07_07205 [Nitrososphaera sp.]|jgi:hypothetical protein